MRKGLVLLAAAVLACGPKSPSKEVGSEGGPCGPASTCDDGLTCEGNVCVALVLPDASTLPRPDARPTFDAPPRIDARPLPDAAVGSPDARLPVDAPMVPDAPIATTGALSVTWTVTVNGAGSTCAAVGGATVEVVASPAGGGADQVSRFSCSAGSGTSATMPAGSYTLEARILDDTMGILTSVTAPNPVAVVAGQTKPAGGFTFAFVRTTPGTFSLSWDINVGSAPALCADVGAETLELSATPAGGGAPVIDKFDCIDRSGKTPSLQGGTYTVAARLLDGQGDPLASVDLGDATVQMGQNTALGNLLFVFPAQGGRLFLTWSIELDGFFAFCDDVDARTVVVEATDIDNLVTTDIFDCIAHAGTTEILPPGDYAVSAALLDSSGFELQRLFDPFFETVVSGQTTDIGNFNFSL